MLETRGRGRFLRPALRRHLGKFRFPGQRAPRAATELPPKLSEEPLRRLADSGLDPVRLLEELVAIDSVTTNFEGVERVQGVLAARLAAAGFELHWRENPLGAECSARLLEARLAPEGGKGPVRWINFVSHADTVLGLEHVGPLRIDTETQLGRGAGVIDNKGGLAVGIVGLELFLKDHRGPRRYGLRFISSPNEEAGSIGFNEGYRDYARDSILALGFEPALDDGSIIRSRRGNRWYHVKIHGIEAHAGRSRGEHVNAAHELAIKIAKLHKLNDPKNDIAVNVGRIEGGHDRYNVVCGRAEAKLDARFSSFQARDRLHRKIGKILAKHSVSSRDKRAWPSAEYEIVDDCPPFSSTSQSRRLVRDYAAIVSEIEGRPVGTEKAGGAGDVNYMSEKSVVVIDGLGPVGGRMHTEEEFIHLPTLATRAIALAGFLRQVEAEVGPGIQNRN